MAFFAEPFPSQQRCDGRGIRVGNPRKIKDPVTFMTSGALLIVISEPGIFISASYFFAF